MLKKPESPPDIIFEAAEDLYSQTKGQILLLKSNTLKISIQKPRKFSSYANEFCGITGLFSKTLRFLSLGRDAAPDMIITSCCLLKVYHTSEFTLSVSNPLKASLYSLYSSGSYSDVTIKMNGKNEFKVHKCILASRSSKFECMLSSTFMEGCSNIVEIECDSPELFKLLLMWIYCGEIKFPEDILDVFKLMILADEYMLIDLKEKCEEDIKINLDETKVLDVLLLCEKHTIVSNELTDKCKLMFIDEFDKILKVNPDLEEKIIEIPGLMTKLFTHIHAKKNSKKRKVTFVIEEHSE